MQAASSGLPDQARQGISAPLEATNPPSQVTHPPQDMTDPPQEVTDPAQEETGTQQPAPDGDLVDASWNQQADHAHQEVLCPAEVQQAKPKLMVPIFRRRTCALSVSTNPTGPTDLGQLVDSSGSEGRIDLGPSSRDAAEDMIEEDLEKGISTIMIEYQCRTCEPLGRVDQCCLQSSWHDWLTHLC